MLHYESIADPQLDSVVSADDDTASRASCCRWDSPVTRSATLTPVDQEVRTPTHLGLITWCQHESTRPRVITCMRHRVLAPCKGVDISGKRAGVSRALQCRVKVPFFLPGVPMSVNLPITLSSNKSAAVLVVSICKRGSLACQRSAA